MSRAGAAAFALLALTAARAQLGNGATGEQIAKSGNGGGAPACTACHGAHGEGLSAAGYPRLAGLPAPYLEERFDELASGTHRNTAMGSIAAALSSEERRAAAEYFARLKAPAQPLSPAPSAAQGEIARGAQLAGRGHWSVGLPACGACHAPDGTGVGSRFPPLAGQPSAYIASQLRAWQAGGRAPGPLGLMRMIAAKLTGADVAAVAAYYARLPPNGAASGARLETYAGALRGATAPPESIARGESAGGRFRPPPPGSEPGGELGGVIRQGERIFQRPDRYARRYVGNRLHCSNCHLDAGRRADSAPLWAAYVLYPAYRSKNHRINTYQERLQGCFRFSMNGRAPPLGSPVLVALEAYSYWLARGAPTGVHLEGQGYPRLAQPPLRADYARGARVYAERCALCHGPEGAGQSSAAGDAVFPALWGSGSYNWGAGMESVEKAAGFIEANMPLALGATLTLQQAWDVALYVDSHERPQDPRYTGSVASTRARFHDSPYSMYGRRVNGRLLGQGH
jgi:thiosulfate dehydrogenase